MPTPTPPSRTGERGKRPRSSRRRTGPTTGAGSQLAQGEPMVWLTGGTLVLCLVMIVGLLAYICVEGFATFWPAPIDRVQLYNGQAYMGEQTREQWFTPPADFADDLPDAAKQQALAMLERHGGRMLRRHFYTGNFDVADFRDKWIDACDIADESRPQWALAVERLKDGPFFGTPRAFVIRTLRKPAEREKDLAALLAFVDQHPPAPGSAPGSAPQSAIRFTEEQWRSLTPAVDAAREELRQIRENEGRAFLSTFDLEPGNTLIAAVAEPQDAALTRIVEKPLDQVDPATDVVTEVRRVWSGPQAAYQQFERNHDARVAAYERSEELKSEISHNGIAIENARLDVREAELADELELLGPLAVAQQIQLDLGPARAQVRKLDELAATVERLFPAETQASPLGAATLDVMRREREAIEAQTIRPAQQQYDKLMAPVRDAPPAAQRAIHRYLEVRGEVTQTNDQLRDKIEKISADNARYQLVAETVAGREKTLAVAEIVRAYPANQLGFFGKTGVYLSRWMEFLTAPPRQANMEGGVFPAIVGTVLMTLLMCILVVPFGVLAALYLREYAKAGPIISAVRISINNLAGVPSIVFGVFGLGFFIYIVGAYIDGGPEHAFGAGMILPRPWWFLTLTYAALASICGAIVFSLSSLRKPNMFALRTACVGGAALLAVAGAGVIAGALRCDLWLLAALLLLAAGLLVLAGLSFRAGLTANVNTPLVRAVLGWQAAGLLSIALLGVVVLVAMPPFFDGFFQARLSEGNPTFGKTALIWASFTLALLTLPVVIVATEEALAAVPNSMREGSYACGASKWQTIQRIVLPRAMPGVMTGTILAMARGAGEVAPLMLVGAVKWVPELPFSIHPSEQFGLNRSFMHLGFHIFDVGFQSPDSEAARPMVFTTTLLLILIVLTLNVAAIWMRSRLRRRFQGSAF